MRRFLASLVLAGFAAGAEDAAPPSADKLHTAAQKEYLARNYKAACPHFESAASLAPERGDYWADAGVCWPHLGNKTSALAADRKAAQSADPVVRANAYYNISKIDRGIDWSAIENLPPGETGDSLELHCSEIVPDVVCASAAPLRACLVFDGSWMGNGGGTMTYGAVLTHQTAAEVQHTIIDRSAERDPDTRERSDQPERLDGGLYFDLGSTDECHPHQHPEQCEGFDGRDTRRAPPKISFVDNCSGRAGFVWKREGLEAQVPQPVASDGGTLDAEGALAK